MSWSPVSRQDGPMGPLDDVVATPGSLQIKERRSWPTWALVAGALVAGALGAVIGYLPDRAAPSSASTSGPSFPSVNSHSPTSVPSTPTGATTTLPPKTPAAGRQAMTPRTAAG